MDDQFENELESRLQLLESPGGAGMAHPDLARADVVAAILGVVTTILVMLWWAF
ncbi:MAG: hypothetical protein H5T78_27870 [Nocardia sp.]|nr:hypothetical protein [Nocardia sp.]